MDHGFGSHPGFIALFLRISGRDTAVYETEGHRFESCRAR
jgi:hypothetical protein